jgi:hypothetical protein
MYWKPVVPKPPMTRRKDTKERNRTNFLQRADSDLVQKGLGVPDFGLGEASSGTSAPVI